MGIQTIKTMATVSAPAHRHLKPNIDDPVWNNVRDYVANFMIEHDVKTHVSFLAPGFDQLCASTAHWLGKDIAVVRPFPDHARPWPPKERETAEMLMLVAKNITTISQTPTRASVREAYAKIVDEADALLVLDAGKSAIVSNATKRAQERNIPIYVSSGLDIMDGTFHTLQADGQGED